MLGLLLQRRCIKMVLQLRNARSFLLHPSVMTGQSSWLAKVLVFYVKEYKEGNAKEIRNGCQISFFL